MENIGMRYDWVTKDGMGFTCILQTNIVLDGHCWDFKESLYLNTIECQHQLTKHEEFKMPLL